MNDTIKHMEAKDAESNDKLLFSLIGSHFGFVRVECHIFCCSTSAEVRFPTKITVSTKCSEYSRIKIISDNNNLTNE